MPKLTPILFDVFYDGEFMEEPPPITQNDIDTAEQRLGHPLPPDYVELLKYQNGGFLRKHLSNDSGSPLGIIRISGIGDEDGIDHITDGVTLNQKLIENWGYPKESIIFAHQGSAGFGFDYENLNDDGEPTIFCMNNDRIDPILYRRVFLSFRQLIESLARTPEE